jgi:hypothetical protein
MTSAPWTWPLDSGRFPWLRKINVKQVLPVGKDCLSTMSFGHCNAPTTFKRIMDQEHAKRPALETVSCVYTFFVDYIVVAGPTIQEVVRRLGLVLDFFLNVTCFRKVLHSWDTWWVRVVLTQTQRVQWLSG